MKNWQDCWREVSGTANGVTCGIGDAGMKEMCRYYHPETGGTGVCVVALMRWLADQISQGVFDDDAQALQSAAMTLASDSLIDMHGLNRPEDIPFCQQHFNRANNAHEAVMKARMLAMTRIME